MTPDETIRQALYRLRYPTTNLWLMIALQAHRDGMTPAELAAELERNPEKPQLGGGSKAASKAVGA